MIIESVQFSTNQVWAYNAILKYVVMGNALPNHLQRYEKICRCANIWRRKIGKICEIEEKVVILCGEWGFSPCA